VGAKPQVAPSPHEAGERRHPLVEAIPAVAVFLFAITVLVQSFVIPTISMEDTLLRGDHLLVDKLTYAPPGVLSKFLLPYREVRRGDIIVFRWPVDIRQNYVKRVIGIPGDRIRIVNKQVHLNGQALDEPYKYHKTSYFDSYRDNFPGEPNVKLADGAVRMLEAAVVSGAVVVPPGCYFVMGDNRDNSLDSRYWGFVPRVNITGTPLLVIWSYDAPTEQLAGPGFVNLDHVKDLARNFFWKTRWSRTFHLIRGYPVN
jgi:signal peptidase I